MTGLDDRTKANMDVVLDEACRALPHGGDHAIRKRVAQKLMQSARNGNTTLGGLALVAHSAFIEVTRDRKSA